MDCALFNINSGYVEGIVRGYRNQLLTSQQYNSLTQCESVDDVRLQLSGAYGEYVSMLPPNSSSSILALKTTEKMVVEFRYLQANVTGSMAKFMEYVTYAYMIDNIALLITGKLHERDSRELLERCHPLGWFETMLVLTTATNVEELYNSVLIETPLAPYLKNSLTHQDLDDLNIEIIRNTLYKNYLDDFYHFVNTEPELAGSSTAEVMSEVLQFEADRRCINIALNSFDTDLTREQKLALFPTIGRLYPHGTALLANSEDIDGVRAAVAGVAEYKAMFEQAGLRGSNALSQSSNFGSGDKSLEDLFYQKEMELMKLVFTRQFAHSIVYAWLKLKEQEIRNLTWIAECITQNQRSRIGNYIHVY